MKQDFEKAIFSDYPHVTSAGSEPSRHAAAVPQLLPGFVHRS